MHPGWVASEGELTRINVSGMDINAIEGKLPMGKMQTGEDVANAVTSG